MNPKIKDVIVLALSSSRFPKILLIDDVDGSYLWYSKLQPTETISISRLLPDKSDKPYKNESMKTNTKAHIINPFTDISRYLDDVFDKHEDNRYFDSMKSSLCTDILLKLEIIRDIRVSYYVILVLSLENHWQRSDLR